MATHYHDMGLYFDDCDKEDFEKELVKMFHVWWHTDKEVVTPTVKYDVITIDDAIEYWLVLNDKRNIEDIEIHYKTDTRTKIKFEKLFDIDEEGAVGLVSIWDAEEQFPMNISIPDIGNIKDLQEGEYLAQIVAFAQSVKFYPNEEASQNDESNHLMAEAFIPMGTFPLNGHEDEWEPSADVIMSAIIDDVIPKVNSYSGRKYFLLKVHCMDFQCDVLVDEESMPPNISKGGVVNGDFWLSGHIYKS